MRQVGYIQGTNQHVSWKRIFVIIWLPKDSFQPYLLFCVEQKDAHVDDEDKWTQSLCYDIPVPIYGEMVIKSSQWSVCGMQIKKMCRGQLWKT